MFTVAPHCLIMEQLDLKDLSRKLVAICAISYFFSLYLILYIGVQTFDVTWCKILEIDLNKA
jgi:predicted RNA-binding protein